MLMATSDDFIHWTEPQWIDLGETPAEHFYTNATTPYFPRAGAPPRLSKALRSRPPVGSRAWRAWTLGRGLPHQPRRAPL